MHKNTFLTFDRATMSLWYPLEPDRWTAVSGPRQGETIPFLCKPAPVKLGVWRMRHPDTLVLLGSRARIEQAERAARTRQEVGRPPSPDDRYEQVELP